MPVRVDDPAPRELIVSPTAALQVDTASTAHVRFRQVYDGLIWLLVRNPEMGESFRFVRGEGVDQTTTTGWMVRFTGNDKDLPDVLLSYKYDDRTVTLRGIRCMPHGATRVL